MSRDARIAAQRLANMTCHFETLVGTRGWSRGRILQWCVNATESWQLDCRGRGDGLCQSTPVHLVDAFTLQPSANYRGRRGCGAHYLQKVFSAASLFAHVI